MSYLNELIRVLSEEQKLYTKLTNIAHSKQQVIIANDVEKLAQYLKEEQELIDHIEAKEKERRQAVIGLCTELNISEKELSFTKLRDYMNEETRAKLDRFKSNLLEILEEFYETNEMNRVLIEEAMRINDFTIRVLTQATTPPAPTYGKTGVNENKPQHLLDKKV